MKHQRPLERKHLTPRSVSWVAVLLVVALVVHSFDVCASHIGGLTGQVQTTTHLECQNPAGAQCSVCTSQNHPSDICEVISEVSTPAAHGFQLDAPVILASPSFVLPVDVFVLDPPGEVARSRDGPDIPSPVALHLRSNLLGRSPPLSA